MVRNPSRIETDASTCADIISPWIATAESKCIFSIFAWWRRRVCESSPPAAMAVISCGEVPCFENVDRSREAASSMPATASGEMSAAARASSRPRIARSPGRAVRIVAESGEVAMRSTFQPRVLSIARRRPMLRALNEFMRKDLVERRLQGDLEIHRGS